jgi:hypothetical protein
MHGYENKKAERTPRRAQRWGKARRSGPLNSWAVRASQGIQKVRDGRVAGSNRAASESLSLAICGPSSRGSKSEP